MNLFDVKRIKWYKYMDNTIENVKLSKISFLADNEIVFSFLNSNDGGSCGDLRCSGTLKCNIEYDSENAKMPYFILDVRVKKLSGEELEDALKYFRYGFGSRYDSIRARQCNLVSVIGSEVCIDVLCERYELS